MLRDSPDSTINIQAELISMAREIRDKGERERARKAEGTMENRRVFLWKAALMQAPLIRLDVAACNTSKGEGCARVFT